MTSTMRVEQVAITGYYFQCPNGFVKKSIACAPRVFCWQVWQLNMADSVECFFALMIRAQRYRFSPSSGILYRFIASVSLSTIDLRIRKKSPCSLVTQSQFEFLSFCWCEVQFHSKSSEKVQWLLILNMKRNTHTHTHTPVSLSEHISLFFFWDGFWSLV
jgi:hypothetical protein